LGAIKVVELASSRHTTQHHPGPFKELLESEKAKATIHPQILYKKREQEPIF
jgi:hypothetical protein